MTTIKSFTSLEQSKKLAEILPIESADMGWNVFVDDSTRCLPINDWNLLKNGEASAKFIPCWSLAALLSVIPQEIFDGEYIVNITEGCDNKWVLTYDHYENKTHSYYGLSSGADNLIDACYEMIVKLKKIISYEILY